MGNEGCRLDICWEAVKGLAHLAVRCQCQGDGMLLESRAFLESHPPGPNPLGLVAVVNIHFHQADELSAYLAMLSVSCSDSKHKCSPDVISAV